MIMKVVAYNGSPRRDGNTSLMIKTVFDELEKENIECELVNLSGKTIHGCIACYKCAENQDKRCAVKNDIINDCIEKMLDADGIILASPTYFSNVTAEMKALIDRTGLVAKVNNSMFKRKVGAAIVTVRRAGAVHVFNSINHFFLIGEMIIPGSSYWNLAIGLDKGDVRSDTEGIQTMENLGKNMAWILKKIKK
jgi:multimeric flavodoxin WrbA